MRCGRTSPCVVKRRSGIRFKVTTNPALKMSAKLVVHRKVGRRWVKWAYGSITVPYKGILFVPSRIVPPGTYRVRVDTPARGSWLAGAAVLSWRIT
jgi:hypothetical protein